MAKLSLACKDGKTQKKHIGYSFSESEMDVARQLIQLSGDSDDNHNHDDNNMNSSEVKVEHSKGDDAADVCSTNNIRETIEEVDDEIFDRRKRRFRSIYHVYKSTKPVIIANAKRRKLAVV